MYAVTAWTFNSIWASAILHMLWNINGLLNITTQDDHWGIYQYILDTKCTNYRWKLWYGYIITFNM